MKWFDYCNKGERKRSVFLKIVQSAILTFILYFFAATIISPIFLFDDDPKDLYTIWGIYVLIYLILEVYFIGLIWGNIPLNTENLLLLPLWKSFGLLRKYSNTENNRKALVKSVFPILISLVLFPIIAYTYWKELNTMEWFYSWEERYELYGPNYQLLGLLIFIAPLLILIYEIFNLHFRYWISSDK